MTNGTAQGQPQNLIAPIRSVRIQNFRSVRDLTIDLAPDVTVFFGVNAAGKTALLEALAIGLGAIVARVPKVRRGFRSRTTATSACRGRIAPPSRRPRAPSARSRAC
jgi:hypothetical protein